MSNLFSDIEGCTLHHTPYYGIQMLERTYVIIMDASKYGWAGVLTQLYEENNESTQSNTDPDVTPKKTVIHHPVTYISGLFRGCHSQRKQMLTTCQSESSALTSPMLMFSSGVTTYC